MTWRFNVEGQYNMKGESMIGITCPNCRKSLKMKSETAGRKGRCPSCGYLFDLPTTGNRPIENSKPHPVYGGRMSPQKEKRVRRLLIYENVAKNILVIGCLWFILPQVQYSFKAFPENLAGNVLSTIGLLLAGSVAGRFAFSYEKTNIYTWIDRLFGHLTTFLLTFGIGLMLEIAVVILALHPGLYLFWITLAAVTVFAAIILCDFWDVLRLAHYEGRGR